MVVALRVLDALLPQPVDGVGVAHAQEGTLGRLELRVVLLDGGLGDGVLEGEVDDAADDVLEVVEEVVEADKVELALDVCVLGELWRGMSVCRYSVSLERDWV